MNMKNINILKYTVAAGLAIASLSSCDLDLVPEDAIAYEEGKQLFLTANDVKSFENGVLSSYRSIHYGVFYYVPDLICDGFNAAVDYGNKYGSIHRCDESFTSSDYDTEDLWENNYYAIKNYNIVISNADNVDASIRNIARIAKGEAFFCRASSYLNLARHYGKAYGFASDSDLAVPLVLVYDQLAKPARATVKETYAQVKSDLDSAAVILAKVPGSVRAQKPTIDAVNALYARYYLDTKNYTDAAKFAELVISSKAGYALASTEEEMKTEYTNDEGKEPIMQMFASMNEGKGAITVYTNPGNDKKEGVYLAPFYLPTKALVDAYDDNDLRFKAWFSNEYPVRMSGSFFKEKFYSFTKYLDNPNLHTGEIPVGTHAVKTLLVGEMYLIAAEAYAQSGNVAKAKELLNALQLKRGAVATSGDLANVKKEWFRETVGEGLRYSCLKRWGDGFSAREPQVGADEAHVLMTGQYYEKRSMEASDYHFLYPVPAYELKLNKNLVQNDGYTVTE